jgi:Gliding motility associated protein GldN
MNRHQVIRIIFAAIILFAGTNSFGQKAGSTTVWKKQVYRVLNAMEKEDTKEHHLKNANPDTTMLEMMINAIKSGKLTAYSNYDHSFTTRLTMAQLNEMLLQRPDTQVMVDPITGKEATKVISHEFDFYAVTKYRLLEEWTFNPVTGKTDIQITGISPVRGIYGENGDFRGIQSIFWLKYPDVINIIARYEQYHPDNTIASKIWNDYFSSDTKPEAQK